MSITHLSDLKLSSLIFAYFTLQLMVRFAAVVFGK